MHIQTKVRDRLEINAIKVVGSIAFAASLLTSASAFAGHGHMGFGRSIGHISHVSGMRGRGGFPGSGFDRSTRGIGSVYNFGRGRASGRLAGFPQGGFDHPGTGNQGPWTHPQPIKIGPLPRPPGNPQPQPQPINLPQPTPPGHPEPRPINGPQPFPPGHPQPQPPQPPTAGGGGWPIPVPIPVPVPVRGPYPVRLPYPIRVYPVGYAPPGYPTSGSAPQQAVSGGGAASTAASSRLITAGSAASQPSPMIASTQVTPDQCVQRGPTISLTFVPTVTAGDITSFLQSYNVSVAAGPNPDGVYRIRLAAQALSQGTIDEVVTSMRNQTAIVDTIAE